MTTNQRGLSYSAAGALGLAACLVLGTGEAHADAPKDAGSTEVLECSVPPPQRVVVKPSTPKPVVAPPSAQDERTITLTTARGAMAVQPLHSAGMNYRDLRPTERPLPHKPAKPDPSPASRD